MKRLLPLLAILISGCVIHSVQPFYTENSRVTPNELLGKWQLLKNYDGLNVSTNGIPPWSLEPGESNAYTLATYDEDKLAASFKVTFFKNGTNLFLDFLPGKIPEETKLNEYWRYAIHPMHGLCKVTITSNLWRLATLDYDWIDQNLKQKKLHLPYQSVEDYLLFTATPEQWTEFLEQYGNSPDAFPEKNAFILQHIQHTPEKKP